MQIYHPYTNLRFALSSSILPPIAPTPKLIFDRGFMLYITPSSPPPLKPLFVLSIVLFILGA